jgi:hypothetical protein
MNTKKNQADAENKFGCETCKMRKKAEANSKSFIARLWRWHTGWCPVWSP